MQRILPSRHVELLRSADSRLSMKLPSGPRVEVYPKGTSDIAVCTVVDSAKKSGLQSLNVYAGEMQ